MPGVQSHRRDRARAKTLVKVAARKSREAGNPHQFHSHREDITMELTRRHALAGAAAIAATPLLPTISAKAAAPAADKQAPSFYRYKVGDIQVNVVSDGNNVSADRQLHTNAKKDELNVALEKAFLPKDKCDHLFRSAGDQHRRQARRDRYRQRPGGERQQQGRKRTSSAPIWRLRASIPRRSTWW